MKLLIDAHIFDEKHQGTRTYLKGLYTELIPIAADWHFFLVAHDTENLNKEFGSHQNVTYVPLKSKNKFNRLLIELPLIIKKYNIDYAHYQYICPPIKNCNIIITTHDILFEQNEFKEFFPLKYRILNGYLFKRSAKKADVLLTVSEYSRKKISEIYNIPITKINITPNAVSSSFGHDLPKNVTEINKLGKYILYVSRIEPRKNHLTLIKAFIELGLREHGYSLVFIGRKDIPNLELESYLTKQQNKISNSIIWLDNIPNENLAAYYKQCELFVFPSLAEGFGIPPLEAMATGRKMLCSKNTAMADFNLPDPLTFEPKNVEELKRKIMAQLDSQNIQFEVYDKILAKYNWRKIAQSYYKLLIQHYNIIK